jgi:hypothetical protein
MFSQTYSWALRRVFKFVLKRALGRVVGPLYKSNPVDP